MVSHIYNYVALCICFVLFTILYYEFTNRLLLLNILSIVTNSSQEKKPEKAEVLTDQVDESEEYFLSSSSFKSANERNLAPRLNSFPQHCKEPILWGREHHGGWYICKDFFPVQDKCIIYSFGLGADWSFDVQAEQFGCEVHGFDPSNLNWKEGMHGKDYNGIDYANQYPSKLKFFHNWGLGAAEHAVYPPGTIPQDWPGLGDPPFSQSNSEPWETKSLERTILDLGHMQKKLSIIKIDVEGAEWDAIQAFIGSKETKDKLQNGFVSQLLFEFHWDPESRAKNKRHQEILNRIRELGFIPWKIETHQGSECCLDISYVWRGKNNSGNDKNHPRRNFLRN